MWSFLKWFFRPRYVWVLVFYATDEVNGEAYVDIGGIFHSENAAREAFTRHFDFLTQGKGEWEISREEAIKSMNVCIDDTSICVQRKRLE